MPASAAAAPAVPASAAAAAARGPPAFRTYLDTPFAQKDACKALGGRWDRKRKAWYAPAGVDLSPFVQQWCQRHDLNAQRVP